MLAARVELKNGPQGRCSKPDDLIQAPTPLASLDQNTIPAQHQNVSRGTPSRMITIPGNSDHHHLESVITIIWND
jgi:hypothetical protein